MKKLKRTRADLLDLKLLERLISKRSWRAPMEPQYVYVFVRQDLSPEQQAVQAAHVTLVLGNKLKNVDVSELYFALIGIPQLIDFRDVIKALDAHGTKYETFYEPDQGNTLTAIATYPINRSERGKLRDFKLLRFNHE